jgi:histone acetyltransferase (RNA polymerase elongator complex component)
VDEVKRDIDAMKAVGVTSSSAFLQDANSIIMKPEQLAEILVYFREKFPEVERITTYARADTLSRITPENMKMLREAGLDRVHSGYETGSDQILQMIHKGTTRDQQVRGGLKVKEAGMELSMYFMPGVGGKALSEENSRETAGVINEVDPDFVRLRTFVAKPGTPMGEKVQNGSFVPCTDEEKVTEIRRMLEQVEGCTGVLVSDHIVNLLEDVRGSLKTQKEEMIGKIRQFEALEPFERRRYQAARRMGFVRRPSDMDRLPADLSEQISGIVRKFQTSEQWEDFLNYFLEQYI